MLWLLGVTMLLSTSAGEYASWNFEHPNGFRLMNNTRCTGHYKLLSMATDPAVGCHQACQDDLDCSSFSFNHDASATCFLFDHHTTCDVSSEWVSGFKDTRCATASLSSIARVGCPTGMLITNVDFVEFGNPAGDCGAFVAGSCRVEASRAVIEDLCIGDQSCTVAVDRGILGDSTCLDASSQLKLHVTCGAGLTFHEDVYFNKWSSQFWESARSDGPARQAAWQQTLGNVPAFKSLNGGQGIIIVAGGKYLKSAIVSIKLLRDYDFEGRIQVWHLGDDEMTSEHRALLAPYNVEMRDFEDFVKPELLQPIAANVGLRLFQLKPLALLHTDLDEVLLIDSDNSPLENPAYLFEVPEYKKTGSLFWPDYWKTSKHNPIWSIVGVKPSDSWEQESGQLVVQRSRAWQAINLAVHFNSEFYMRLLNGDKDTFKFAWIASKTPYTMVSILPTAVGTLKELHSEVQRGFCSHTMLQHDPSGKPLFVHHNQLKSTHLPLGENFKYQKTAVPDTGALRVVPVAGLHLESGAHIACNDFQGEALGAIDEDVATVSQSTLGAFEIDYLHALSSVPADLFSEPALEGVRRDRRALNLTGNCDLDQFELGDGQCEIVAACSAGETETAPPTGTSDRLCVSNTDKYTMTFLVGSTGSAFTMKSTSQNRPPIASAQIIITRGAQYKFEIEAGIAQDLVIERTNGNIYTDGVVNNFAVGGQTLELSTGGVITNNINALAYAHGGASSPLIGGQIGFEDSSFVKDVVGARVFKDAVNTRYSTAYNPNVRVFTEFEAASGPEVFRDLRVVCLATCETTASCAGIHIYQTTTQTTCFGLNDLGEPTTSIVDSQGWSKQTVAMAQNP